MIFILVHGGMHGGWCWEHVVPLLEEAGHKALAPDLPGMGGDRTPLDQITLDVTGRFIAELVRAQKEPVVLVGHSMGGPTISEAAERVPERLVGLIFVTANLSPGGQSMNEFCGAGLEGVMRGVILSEDGVAATYDPMLARDVFYNTTDPSETARAIARLRPQPIAPTAEPLTITDARFGRVPRAYVECLQDNALPIDLQRRMQAELPCEPVVTLNCDHSPFLCAPKELAEALITIGKSFSF